MKLFEKEQIQRWDQATIARGISSIDLMERAALAIVDALCSKYDKKVRLACVAGPGNNGGDALAVTRLLRARGYDHVTPYLIVPQGVSLSTDCLANMERLEGLSAVDESPSATDLQQYDLIIDGLFGTGLKRPLEGLFAAAVNAINESSVPVVSIDIPSGTYTDRFDDAAPCVHAHQVLTLQIPKRAFLLPESARYMRDFQVLDIGLDSDFHRDEPCDRYFLEASDVPIPSRDKFSHKGTYGHAFLLAGSRGMYGAAQLSARACLRAGVGLLTVRSGAEAMAILQTMVPEAMYSADPSTDHLSQLPDLSAASALACGPGIGLHSDTVGLVDGLLQLTDIPLILDADALNIIAAQSWQARIPAGTIITPHPKEFERLFGATVDSMAAVELQRKKAQELRIIILRKGAHSSVALPDGSVYFNSTGNPYMATGGMGDVLTGVLLALRARKMSAERAALTAVFHHGRAGDRALELRNGHSIISSDVIESLAF